MLLRIVKTVKAEAKCRRIMGVMFVFVLGVVVGFGLCLMAREWLKGRELSQKARIAREENDGN